MPGISTYGPVQISGTSSSLNPVNVAAALANVPQTHFLGARDVTVPPASMRRFLSAVPKARVITLERFTHTCCWADDWMELLARSCLASAR